MNELYLMRDEKKNFALFKVGFATDLNKRIYQYTTHNPLCECISHVRTQERSGRNIEKMFHDEIISRGYELINAIIDGKSTEWFCVSYDDPFYVEICKKELNAFKCGRSRKNYGCFVLNK